ncbi:MAG: SDR family NAD(P)-dependent oxidoreductase [candidate division Zixibacteria bacterium]|nr:SDR family NAD(P)-dependent oxidoreductase [candidate division Zixibacteria bacterium]
MTSSKTPNSLSGKRVSVSGADGFIGSHLVERLVENGAHVRAMVFYNSFGRRGWLDDCPDATLKKIEIVAGDIRDARQMRDFVSGTEYLFHLASLIAIPYSYQAVESYVETNIRGTMNLLEASREHKITRFVHTSTSEVYGSAQTTPMNEEHPLSAQSPYAATKIAADQLALSYYRSYDLSLTVLRPFNTYGPRQSSRAVIPTIISQIAAGKTEISLGALHPMRDFLFIDDTIDAFIQCATATDTGGEVIHIGSGKVISIGQLAALISRLMNRTVKVTEASERLRPKQSEVDRLLCDHAKASRLLNWHPCIGLESGLLKTIAWFSNPENLKLYAPDRYGI